MIDTGGLPPLVFQVVNTKKDVREMLGLDLIKLGVPVDERERHQVW